jgi:hypothetical protein
MSRAVVYQALTNNSQLQALGFDNAHVLVNYDGEQRPSITINNTQPYFMVITWGVQDIINGLWHGPWHFDVWIHMDQEYSSDFDHIDQIVQILDSALTGIVDTAGADGRSVTVIEQEGRSQDLQDDSYLTFCKRISYRMISRVTATGKV